MTPVLSALFLVFPKVQLLSNRIVLVFSHGTWSVFAKVINRDFFQTTVWPKLRPLLTAREIPTDAVFQMVSYLSRRYQ